MSVNDPILEALSFTLERSGLGGDGSGRESGSQAGAGGIPTCEFTASGILLGEEERTTCIFPGCDYATEKNISWGDKQAQGEVLSHLLENHKLVIDNCDGIANLTKYLKHWKGKFERKEDGEAVKDFCIGFKMEQPQKPKEGESRKRKKRTGEQVEEGNKEQDPTQQDNLYYMLSPVIPEDSELRKNLWKQRLNVVLEVNREEREDNGFCRRCLFCRDVIRGNRSDYFNHMRDSHSFHIGQPDNLVFVRELLQLIENKLNRLECLFCEHVFKDKVVLKEHMRKKQHRKLNPKNQEYDRYYLVNYLEPGKTWETIEMEDVEEERKEDEWMETPEDKESNVVCLFCKFSHSEFSKVLEHMKQEHSFNFEAVAASFDFYQKVKLVNYIRRTVYQNICLLCADHFPEPSQLLSHISTHQINGHVDRLPKTEEWNQPEYFFPTYEEDDFLTCLDSDTGALENETASSQEDEGNVIPEDLPQIDMKNRDFDLAGFAIKYHNQNI